MRLAIYKPDQGRALRLATYFGSLVMILWMCFNLYQALPSDSVVYEALAGPYDVFGVMIQIDTMLLISAGVLLVFGVALYFFFNWPKMAEFLIETEGELKKVSFPERKEYVGASLAVVVLIIFIVVYLYLVDVGLTFMMTRLKIGF